MNRAVTDETFGAWLLKRTSRSWDVRTWVAGAERCQEWCVQPGYRSARMRAGDPVVVWVSGTAPSYPAPGVWGLGRVSGPATQQVDALAVPVDVAVQGLLLPREQLRHDPVLQGMEVLRQPQMGNPGWLTVQEWTQLQHLVAAAGHLRPRDE